MTSEQPPVVISFRPLEHADLPLLREWLGREHVARWWGPPPTLEAVAREYGPAISGAEPTRLYVILLDGRAAGLIQTYRLDDWRETWAEPETREPGAAGMDLFLAEESLLGRGLGPRVIRRFVAAIVFADPAIRSCWADPAVANRRSWRAFEQAGFQAIRDVWAPDAGKTERLVRLGRDEPGEPPGQPAPAVPVSEESNNS